MSVHIFIFRRDLRINDNLALNALLKRCEEGEVILPIFIFNKEQIDAQYNKYYSKNGVEFMIQSLKSLSSQLHKRLNFFEGKNDLDILDNIQLQLTKQKLALKSIVFNIDFTPYAVKRDESILKWCESRNIMAETMEDYTLLPLNCFTTINGTFFSVYTPYYRKFLLHKNSIPKVERCNFKKLHKNLFTSYLGTVKETQIDHYYQNKKNEQLFVKGGRKAADVILDKIREGQFTDYEKLRDYPSLDGTTRLSAYLKYGCISIRETFEAIEETHGIEHGLIRELIWREFYANVTFNKPHVLNGQIGKENLAFKSKYDAIKWEQNDEWFEKWCKGETGVPLVDAAMRQLNTTGWMHNRCRMIAACFLVKDMLIDWRRGEQYFATQLVDYDPSSNSGGWQFCSSTGVDAQPYFRIFNPYTQSKKFDVNCDYIKKWVKELQDVPPLDIHKWNEVYPKYENNLKYPKPVLLHNIQSKKALVLYKDVS
jgi:deoxyribodipyrimidine photo-lyase